MIKEWLNNIYCKIFSYKKTKKINYSETWMCFTPKDWNCDLKKDLKNKNDSKI